MLYSQERLAKYSFFDDLDINTLFDSLTGVFDRKTMLSFVHNQILLKNKFALCICDFDNFKLINDEFGHYNGDIVLSRVSKCVAEVIGDKGFVGRFGGDEFLFFIDGVDVDNYDEVWAILKRVNNNVKGLKFIDSFGDLLVTQTIGCARFPFDGDNFEALFKKADKALYRGKQKGRNCFIIYLDEKHKDIDVTGSSPMVITKNISKFIHFICGTTESAKKKINSILEMLSEEYLIDHLCVQNSNTILYDYRNPKNPNKDYIPFNNKSLNGIISENMYYTYNFSDVQEIDPILHEELANQHIKAFYVHKLSFNGKDLGWLRIEDSTLKRIWQDGEMVSYISAANAISYILYLEDIKK